MDILFDLIGAVVLVLSGILIGAHNAVTVDKAISTIEDAEKSAQATLSKIVTHKTT